MNQPSTPSIDESILRFVAAARPRFSAGTKFEAVDRELEASWTRDFALSGKTYTTVRSAVEAAWSRRDEAAADALANKAAFTKPPTFEDSGRDTPRNLDEPNR